MKLSKNVKLNKVLNEIYDYLDEMREDVKRYKEDFPNEIDFNIAQYGNLLIYYWQIRELYKNCGYKSIDKYSDYKLWEIYKRQVGYIARLYF